MDLVNGMRGGGGGGNGPMHPLQGGILLPAGGNRESSPSAQGSPQSCCAPRLAWPGRSLSGASSLLEPLQARRQQAWQGRPAPARGFAGPSEVNLMGRARGGGEFELRL